MHQQQQGGGFSMLPPAVKNLLIINGLFFLGTYAAEVSGIRLSQYLGLYYPESPNFMAHQIVTHMFMHGGLMHIFFNMFALWMFGNAIENFVMGTRRFLIYYLLTGFGAAALHLGVNALEIEMLKADMAPYLASGYSPNDVLDALKSNMSGNEIPTGLIREMTPDQASFQAVKENAVEIINQYFIPTVGASGAVFGILLAFGMFFPNQLIYIYFLFPIKAKYLVMILGAAELLRGFQSGNDSGIAHFAHLGGMIFGFILIKLWRRENMSRYGR